MINLALVEFSFALILLLLALIMSHTINGVIQSYVTYLLGDSTARDEGLLSLNPLMHIEPFGIFALIFFGIGWLQTVPIDPYAFTGRWRYLSLLIAYGTEAVVSVFMATLSLFLCVFFFGYELSSLLVLKIFTYRPFSCLLTSTVHFNIASLFSEHQSSLAIVCAFFLISVVYLNILIATISLIYNAFRYILIVGFERGYKYVEYAEYLSFFGPILVMFLFVDQLIFYFLRLTEWGVYSIAYLFGV